ncbi:MAG: VOC family protein [Sandaracinaceae bacterium]
MRDFTASDSTASDSTASDSTASRFTLPRLVPRLVVDRPDEAIAFYRDVFDAEPLERFEDARGVVVHAALRVGETHLSMTQSVRAWGLDSPAHFGGSAVLLHLTLDDPDGACARAVERGAHVVIPIEDRPYGKREGRLRDPFGHLWVLSRDIERLSADEIQRRLGAR